MTDARNFIEKAFTEAEHTDHMPHIRMQFSMRAMLIFTAFFAVLCAILFAFPPVVAAVFSSVLHPCMTTALLTWAIFARGEIRLFCAGALIPTAFSLFHGRWGGGIGNYWFTVILSQQLGRQASANDITLGEYCIQMVTALGKFGYPMLMQMLTFWLLTACCGLTAVWTRRYLVKQSIPPTEAATAEAEASMSEGE